MGREERKREREIARQLNPWTKRRVTAWTLFGLAIAIGGQHLHAHAGWRPLPLSMGWQDILVGYPTAIVLAIVGAITLDPRPGR